MSEENKTQPTPPPVPTAKTSAVPLKKETVRITLRARPGIGVTQPKDHTAPISILDATSAPHPITTSVTPAGAATAHVSTSPIGEVGGANKSTAPIQLPSAPLPAPATRTPTAQVHLPSAPSIPQPPGAPGGSPRPSGALPPSMAPTIPLAKISGGAIRPPGAPGVPPPSGSPTVPLTKTAGGAPRPPGPPSAVGPKPPGTKVEGGVATVPLGRAPVAPSPLSPGVKPGPTQALPQATVQLGKGTVPMVKHGITPPSAPVKQRAAQDEYFDDKDPEAGLAPLAVVCMILSIFLMGINVLSTDKAGFFADKGSESAFMVPAPADPAWEVKQPDGSHKSTFPTKLSEITKKLD